MKKSTNETSRYSIHQWCRSADFEDSDISPRRFVSYQYDVINDTHYSLPYPREMVRILYESKKGDPKNPFYLLHFTDTQLKAAKAFLAIYFGPISSSSREFDDMAFVAFTQRYSIGNRKIGDLIFTHLLREGHDVDDIFDAISEPYPEIEDGEYPNLKRSLKALAKRIDPKETSQ